MGIAPPPIFQLGSKGFGGRIGWGMEGPGTDQGGALTGSGFSLKSPPRGQVVVAGGTEGSVPSPVGLVHAPQSPATPITPATKGQRQPPGCFLHLLAQSRWATLDVQGTEAC